MAARNLHSPPRRMAGNAVPKIIAAVALLALLGVGGWYFFMRGPAPISGPAQTAQPAAPGADATATAPAAPVVPALDTLTIDQLYKEARTALNEQRMVSPAGNNALEMYLKILEKQPNDSGARDALRELFSTFAASAESAIGARNFDESKRVMDLLAKADPNNYTLTILRSKFDAQQKLVERETAKAEADAKKAADAKVAAEAAAAAAATAAATQPAAGTTTPAAGTTTPAATAATGAKPAAATTAPATAAATPAPAAPKPSGGETRDAQSVRITPAAYPRQAAQRKEEGWVEVEFTVGVDGGISGARVVDSQPARIFDRAALDSVQRWTFNPAMRDGQPVASTLRRRIEFKMGGG